MKRTIKYMIQIVIGTMLLMLHLSCKETKKEKGMYQTPMEKEVTAKEILGNPNYLAISYGGYRQQSRDVQPTIEQLKEDMRILSAMGIKLLRTYNVQLPQAPNILKAIRQLKEEDAGFEMYVMLGAWIDCKNAWTPLPPNHQEESPQNEEEIARAVALAKEYPDIVKILAVGNEAMVKWAASYYVQPRVILKWVNHLQDLKLKGELPKELWITSSDNFASWGGGESTYHNKDLEELISAVDFVSLHTYPMHDTHYNPQFWGVLEEEEHLSYTEKIDKAMTRARDYAISQYQSTVDYIESLGIDKPIHIGETGWASVSDEFYGPDGSKATDEYKQARYYKEMRDWTNASGITCFYFEGFDEQWKDSQNPEGSENHFGLFTIDGKAKYALWPLVDDGVFKGLKRDGNRIEKTYNGNKQLMMSQVSLPPTKKILVSTH
ncbi:glycosyl hydrolase family 17 protein [Sungkyunkwania multivorans]|uniref:Endo-1,3-beta-glucanase btgC n=1 Tax=Sungkyunkwania multivorans TaxID=1173618 RepID=A0ABW3CZX4_9FLAO